MNEEVFSVKCPYCGETHFLIFDKEGYEFENSKEYKVSGKECCGYGFRVVAWRDAETKRLRAFTFAECLMGAPMRKAKKCAAV